MDGFIDLNNYTKQDKIGKGSFEKVFKITEKSSGKIFAAKIALEELTNDQKTLVADFKREANIISQLTHPSIVKFIGYSPVNFKNESYPVIITEYASNGSLDGILKLERESHPPPSWTDTKKLINIYGIASAMSYLHDHEIVHRDLKPSNILEDDYLFPKISDFGLSKFFHPNDAKTAAQISSENQGTPIYTAPENWDNNDYTKAGDVYSFSIIVYEILTLEEPFKDYSNSTYFSKVIVNGDRPEFKKPITDSFKKLITRCWSSNKDERPTFGQIVDELKKNENFLTDSIDKKQFHEYIDMIEKGGGGDLFEKVSISDEPDKPLTVYQKLTSIKEFNDLPNDIQKFFQNELSGQTDKKTIKFNSNMTNSLYEKGLMSSEEFIKALKYFNKLSFDIENPSQNFRQIFTILSEMMKKELKEVKINIITYYLSSFRDFFNETGVNFVVTTPSTTTILRENSFCEVSKMSQISISSSITSIKSNAFSDCTSLEKVSIPSSSSLSEIGESAFYYCTSLRTISIPSSVTSINDFVFQECSKLRQISIPPSATFIGDYAFDRCSSLLEISFPSSVVTIGDFAFRECSSLKQINFDIHSSLSSIGDFAFKECKSLTAISIPPHIVSIGEYAFKGCLNLIGISMPYSLTSVGNEAFEKCPKLEQITIPLTAPPIKIGSSSSTPIITQISNPNSAKRKSIGISPDVKIVKSSKCTIY